MRGHARKFGGAAIAAVIALAVTGCGSSGGSGEAKGSQDTASSATTAAGAPSAPAKAVGTPGTVTVSWCDVKPGTGSTPDSQQLTLASYSMTDGQETARTVTALPPGADTGVLCNSTPTGRVSVPGALRQAFNKDFTLVAGVLPPTGKPEPGPDGPGGSAVAFTLRPQATPVGAPSGDTFTLSPKDRTPAFQSGTSTLWYENRDKHVMSRDLGQTATGTPAPATDRGTSHSWGFALAGDQPWSRLPLGTTFQNVTVNPSGTVAAAGSDSSSGIWLKDAAAPGAGDDVVVAVAFGPNSSRSPGNKALTGGDKVPECTPKFWIDDHSFLCVGKGMSRVVLSDGFDAVQQVEQLLPENDRDNSAVAPSPDLKSVAFLSLQGRDTADLYRLDLTPGATPKKIASIPAHGAHPTSELRLIAWQ